MKKNIIQQFLFFVRAAKNRHFWVILFFDAVFLIIAHLAAYLLRFEGVLTGERLHQALTFLPLILLVKLPTFYAAGLYRGMWRFTSLVEMQNIFKSTCASSAFLVVIILYLTRFTGMSRSVFILDALFTFILIGGLRIAIRYWYDKIKQCRNGTVNGKNAPPKKLLLLGAGDAAEKIIREIKENPQLPYRIIGLLDDDPSKTDKQIHDARILGLISELPAYTEQADIDELLISIASADSSQMKRIIQLCKDSGLPYKAIPGLGSIINGQVSIKAMRDISYEDLLGRSEVKLDQKEIGLYLTDKTVMVTGGGGSIGSELCRQLLQFKPKKIIIFDAGEKNLYSIQMELVHEHKYQDCVPILGQVQNLTLVDKVLQFHKPEVVFHAAAYKHVPLLETNPWEAIDNNVIGTQCIMEAAIKHQVQRFVLVSTDKAVRPANIMGASKRIAELLMQAYSFENWDRKFYRYPATGLEMDDNNWQHTTTFMAVRFGNVLGSSGSVIPLFKRQIELGGPVTVTHPEITRYFMSIPEATQLILQTASMAQGGEIFILQMGQPIRIADLAKELIEMLGKEPDSEIEIKYIGLREGEKLYEELITEGEGIVKTNHEKIMVLKCDQYTENNLHKKLEFLLEDAYAYNEAKIKAALVEIVPEYTPRSPLT
jgi:FlaA1/EpsC-like NDP-sugar epimerase